MTKAFYALLIGVTLLIGSLSFSSDVQMMMLRRFHWRDSSFVRWSLLQCVPSMYNFGNRIELNPGSTSRQMNHFPLRAITFNPQVRQSLAENSGHYTVTLSSHYRSSTLTTSYDLESQSAKLIFDHGREQ